MTPQDNFLNFVAERHRIWELRQIGAPQPWTKNPILARKKFTNVFRVLDPGTQFLFTDLYEDVDPATRLLRAFLYRHTGRIETWRILLHEMGEYPDVSNLDTVLEVWLDYKFTFFTNAYLVYPQSSERGTNKIESIVKLTKRVFASDLVDNWMTAKTSKTRFGLLRANKGVGDFMSMQVLTDWGYQDPTHNEDEFVQLGPGALRGAKALGETVAWALSYVRHMPNSPTLITPWGTLHQPSLMDVQNCLCEYSKYVRYQEKGVADAAPYQPAHPGEQSEPLYPLHW